MPSETVEDLIHASSLSAPAPPAAPVRQFSFTDFQVNNPTAPPPGDRLDAEIDRANNAIEDTIIWVSAALAAQTAQTADPGNFDNDAAGSAALAQDYADVTMAWAEHMPDTIPPNILAVMAVTGDHWSSRWWANRAATSFGARQQLQSLLYQATANQTVFPLTRPDLGARFYTIVAMEALEVFVNGVRLPEDAPNPGFGDWSLDRANSTVTFLTPLRAGALVQIDVLSPDVSDQSSAFYLPASGSPPFVQNDVNPNVHLTRWAVPGPKKVCIIGDSTATEDPNVVSWVDPTMTIWGALKVEITRRNPHCKFMFVNRAIGATNWANPMMTANERSPTASVPAWYTDRDRIWLEYVRDEQPDTLFVLLGTNAPQSGLTAGSSVAKFINDFFIMINAWVKVPDIIIITTKIANPEATAPFLGDQESYKAMASFLRTFARTNGNGYTAFPRVGFFGLLDLGRHYAARVLGKDLAFQYLQKLPSAIQSGYTMVGPYPDVATPLGKTTDGDLRITLVFRNAGGTGMYNALGVTGFYIKCSPFLANRFQISLTASGIWTPFYQTDGTNFAPGIRGVNYSPPVGDVTMTFTLKGEVVQVWLNGTLVMDIQAPRLIAGYTVSISSVLAPLGPMIFDVTEFLEGIGVPSFKTLDPTIAFGSVGGPQGGNDINHPSSSTIASVDYPVIAATNWSAPQPTVHQLKDDKVQIYVEAVSTPNTATTAEEILKQTSLQANLLINVGDTLECEAWGTCATTTDNKTIRMRWGGLTGATISSLNATSASSLRWHARATVVKNAANVQFYGGDGSVQAGGIFGTVSGQTGLPDTQTIQVCVTSQNATTAAAASITCECFRVALIKAPGT